MPSPRRGALRDRGAAALETTGMIAAAALVAGALMTFMLANSPGIAASAKYAVCVILNLGQGECGSRPELIDPHRPTAPCVVSASSGSMNREIAVVFVTTGDGRSFEVALLSDGRYRVTLVSSGSVGAETGIGGGVTVTINDTTVGGSATAEASASLQVQEGSTWYTDAEGAQRLMAEEAEDTIEDDLAGDGGPLRWLWERGQDAVGDITGNGDYDFPPPDETFAQGGVVLNASAEATAITTSAGASVGITEALGVRTGRDGSTTVYLRTKVEGEAGLQQLGIDADGAAFEGANLDGSLEVVTAVTFDSSGAMTQVSTTATAAGSSSGVVNALFGGSSDPDLSNETSGATVFQATLPIRTDADRTTATNFLVATGVSQLGGTPFAAVPAAFATADFISAAQRRGYVTRQDMETDDTTVFAVDASGKLVVELGVSGEVTSGSSRTTSADYWNGQTWTTWVGCAA